MSILSEIIEWAVKQKTWKQDSIKRIIEQGDYTKQDVSEIAQLVLHENGYIDSAPAPKTIDESKFTNAKKTKESKVILKKVESPKNVNALSENAKLQFAFDGITIIYGENGVGKSGYSRILKKSCKAREVDEIHPDVFEEGNNEESKANIYYSVDGDEKNIEWIDGQYEGGDLEQLIVYDSKCGKIQVTDKNELIYLPSGTDIFKKLVNCFGEVKKEIEKYRPSEIIINMDKIDKSSKAFIHLNSINKDTDKDTIEENLKWTDANDKKLEKVSKKIIDAKEDTVKNKVSALNKEVISLEKLKTYFETFEKTFVENKVSSIVDMNKNQKEFKQALDKLTKEMQKGDLLEGTGNSLWQTMYNAAQSFSNKNAYKDATFPKVDGQCVLCQQDLDDAAKKRMISFSKFAEGAIKKNLDEIIKKIEKSKEYLEGLEESITLSKNTLGLSFSELSDEDSKEFLDYMDNVDKRRLKLIQFLKSDIDFKNEDVILKESPSIKIDEIVTKIKTKKSETEKLIDPDKIASLKKEKVELDSLRIASSRAKDASKRIDYLNSLEKFNSMMKELDHTGISKKGSAIITNSLKESFLKAISTELTKLGGEKIPLFVNSTTKEGTPTFQLSLKGANMPKRCKLDSILSEGEQKIASLAGLLAELDTAKHLNGIILDDPVTSLDHRFRKKIAKRLVEEAKKRQVIIFTHDIAFLFDLEYYASSLKVLTHLQNIRKSGTDSGIVYNDNPWHAQNVKTRMTTLRDEVSELSKKSLTGDDYNKEAGAIYGRLRETWERAVEEVLLDQVVTRFGQGIQTQRLSKVSVDDDDFSCISFEMGKCSKYMVGHDKSLALSDDRPEIKDIIKDIEVLNTFIKKINARKKSVHGKRKEMVGRPPQAQVMK